MAEERVTNFYVDYAIEDTTAKQDAVFTCNQEQQAFTNLSRLRYGNTELLSDKMAKTLTFEHNFNILDGTRTELGMDANNLLTFNNVKMVNNSILFEERDDGSVIARSTSKTKHQEAVYSKTVTVKAPNKVYIIRNGVRIYMYNNIYRFSGCAKGADKARKSTYYMSGEWETTDANPTKDTSPDINTQDRFDSVIRISECTEDTANFKLTVSIHIAADYFIEEPLVFYPVLSTQSSYASNEGIYMFARPVIPFFLKHMTDEHGKYENDDTILTVQFTREHSSAALTLLFLDDPPLLLKLTFYDLQGNMITSFTQDVDTNVLVIRKEIKGYSKITIQFLQTLPFRYIKLAGIIFGTTVTWDETSVRDAKLVQQVDRISKNIAVDTLSFTVVDDKSELNLGNPDGINAYFQKNQYMLPYEVVNGKKIELGKYYLKTFSENANLGKLSAQSYLGLMDEVTFNKGEVYNGKKAGLVIEQIFQEMGLTDYIIDAETYEQPLYGTITPKTCRKALNDVLFACNSIINAHDIGTIFIAKTSDVQKPDIPKRSKFSTIVTKNDYTYGVEVKYTSYMKDTATKEIAKTKYSPGEHTVYFTQPYTGITVTNATINSSKTNYYYVTFTVTGTAEKEVTINGYGYQTITNSQKTVQEKLKSGETEKIVSYSTSLCDAKTAKTLSEKILAHLNYDLTIKIKWLADGNDMRDLHIVENPVSSFDDYYGGFTKRSFDLTGGFIDTAEMSGTSLKQSIYKYLRDTDIEVYSGEDDGII